MVREVVDAGGVWRLGPGRVEVGDADVDDREFPVFELQGAAVDVARQPIGRDLQPPLGADDEEPRDAVGLCPGRRELGGDARKRQR
ncbi:hypothetical protein ACFQL1_08260 [Halomicroarcula sp. GCM10025709]|uniref:hypothetical protein n=1 Tax=Halomicroarcula sp. GCM10025709 TaxID=3252669 RepID=UPI0036099831